MHVVNRYCHQSGGPTSRVHHKGEELDIRRLTSVDRGRDHTTQQWAVNMTQVEAGVPSLASQYQPSGCASKMRSLFGFSKSAAPWHVWGEGWGRGLDDCARCIPE